MDLIDGVDFITLSLSVFFSAQKQITRIQHVMNCALDCAFLDK